MLQIVQISQNNKMKKKEDKRAEQDHFKGGNNKYASNAQNETTTECFF